MRRWCSGHSFFCSCDSAVRFLDSENSSQRQLLPRPAPRRVHFARPWTRASKRTLRLLSGREETCRGASRGIIFQQRIRAQHDELLLRVYSRMIRSHERRVLGALLSLFSRSEPRRPTDRYSYTQRSRSSCWASMLC